MQHLNEKQSAARPKRWMALLVMTLLTTVSFAQSKLTGTVVDEQGEPVIGATVVVSGTKLGAVTDLDGLFTIDNAPADAKLSISYVGYVTQQVNAAGKQNIKVTLREDHQMLDEVVAVGYGTMKKSDLTGSVSQVKTKDIMAVTNSNPIASLQGRVTGVSVVNNNRPGESPTLRIRGNGSISAGNDPLYVVDGFPMMNGSMSELNPNDIESIEVLKDASSTAIYGSRGSNGVIMITTKSGRKNSKNLTVNANYGVQYPGRKIDVMSHDQFVDYINYYYKNKVGTTVYNDDYPAPSTNTNWQDELLKSGQPVQDYNVTFDGTSGDTQYLLSGGIFSQDGLLGHSKVEKYTFRTNVSHKFADFLTVGTHAQYTYSNVDAMNPQAGEGLTGIWRTGWNTLPVWHEDGTPAIPLDFPEIATYFGAAQHFNPVYNYTQQTDRTNTSRLFGDVYAEFTLLKGLTFKTNFGLDIANQNMYNYTTSKNTNSSGSGEGGQGYVKKMSKITENILTYQNTWGDHRLTATGVYSWQNYTYQSMNMSTSGFENDETGAFDMEQGNRDKLSYGTDKYGNTLISWTARAAYSFKDRYMLTATARWDGSSRFGENNKWGFFPSVGAAWRASEEKWLRDNKVITNLKLRASYGVTGNQEIGNYQSLAQLKQANYQYNNSDLKGFYETIGNPDLKWERAKQFDFGIDLSLFDRLHFTIDYYNRNTSDLLYEVPIPSTSGFSSMLTNVGKVQNYGLELSVVANVLRTKDWNVSLTGNFSRNKNKIKELYGGVESITLSSSVNGLSQYLKVGEALNTRYAQTSEGIITNEEQLAEYQKIESNAKLGDEMYRDVDGDGKITVKDQVNIGTTDPKYFYGLGLDASYKHWNLNILGNGAYGFVSGTSYLVVAENQLEGAQGVPGRWAYERMWTPQNPNGTLPSPGANNIYMSDRICKNHHYFVVKSIALSYDFGYQPIKCCKIVKGITAGINLENFITFADQRGYNPENGDTSYPWIKTVNFSLSLKF